MSILIVDDNETNLSLLSTLARKSSAVDPVCMNDPIDALYWCESNVPDLVLLDYRMPSLSGNEFLSIFRKMPHMADIPIIMVTTENDRAVRNQAFSLGVTEFLTKPVDTIEFSLRVRNLLALRNAQTMLADRAKLLEHEVRQAIADVTAREMELVTRLARAAEFRDPETGGHIMRMARYSALIARELGLAPEWQELLLKAAPMHDVGKLATPDHILLKPGRLDADEMAIMRQHAEIGGQILAGSDSPLIRLAEEIACGHHEKYDGSGYPRGLAGEQIPVSARIVAVADVFDALTSERPYKPAWPLAQARQFLQQNKGSHFCPRCIDAFLGAWDEVLDIRSSLPDPVQPLAHPL
jgi:response regulator RpfG family c-di-GMP phosphodiesterase